MTQRDLTTLSLAELWELFPIALVAPRPEWQLNYNEMEERLQRLLAPFDVVRISHIGSTAIPGIWAKDIVDVLVEVAAGGQVSDLDADGTESAGDRDGDAPAEENVLDAMATVLEADGFLLMSRTDTRISLNLGYTPEGFADKVYHVHLRYAGDNDEIYFRDYLIDHPDIAHAYEQLKLDLWHRYEFDRDAYTAAKGDFIRRYTEIAKESKG